MSNIDKEVFNNTEKKLVTESFPVLNVGKKYICMSCLKFIYFQHKELYL